MKKRKLLATVVGVVTSVGLFCGALLHLDNQADAYEELRGQAVKSDYFVECAEGYVLVGEGNCELKEEAK